MLIKTGHAIANSEKNCTVQRISTIYRKIMTIPTQIHIHSLKFVKIILSKDENHEKTWFLAHVRL
jgi:hypothetical protein